MELNQTGHSVTENLEKVLRHLRFEHEDLILWIDALCINQNNIRERNEQVSMMGDIYAFASSVLIWIGEADALSDQTFDEMPSIAQGHVDDWAKKKVSNFYFDVYKRPWFSRVWIIKEMALPTQDPVVVCGLKAIAWSTFIAAWTVLARGLFKELGMVRKKDENVGEVTGDKVDVLAMTKIDVLNTIREKAQAGGGESFRQLFIDSRTSEATEPRDRVFGLLGMLKAEERAKISVNYEKPAALVFAEAMATAFESGEGPFFLSAMWQHGGKTSIPDLPTLVLDFTAQTAEKAGHPGSTPFFPHFPTSCSGAGAGAPNGQVLEDLKTLEVEVLPVDIVEDVFEFGATLDECIEQLREVEVLAERPRSKVLPDTPLRPFYKKFRESEPLWRTLISDKMLQSGYDKSPENCENVYKTLLSDGKKGDDDRTDYEDCLDSHLPQRTFFSTRTGLVGVGSRGIRSGDEVTIWFGAPIPLVVRSCAAPEESYSTLIGSAYVGGIMNGEMVDELYCEDLMDSNTLYVI